MTKTVTINWHKNTWPFLPDNLQSWWSNAHLEIEIAHNLNRRIKNNVQQQNTTLATNHPTHAVQIHSETHVTYCNGHRMNRKKRLSTTTRKIDWSSKKIPRTLWLTLCGKLKKCRTKTHHFFRWIVDVNNVHVDTNDRQHSSATSQSIRTRH